MPRHAQLAHEEHVKRGSERLGDLVRNRHAAAWQPEHDDVVPVGVVRERGGETTSGVVAVGEAGFVADRTRVGAAAKMSAQR
jgi:hypothetical protein